MRKILVLIFCLTTTMLWAQQPRLVLPVGHSDYIKFSTFSSDGKKILTVANNIKVWDVVSGKLLVTIDLHWRSDKHVQSARFSRDGMKIIQGAEVWDIYTGEELVNMNGQILATNFPGQFLYKNEKPEDTTYTRIAKVWRESNGVLMGARLGEIDFSPDGQKIVTGCDVAAVWDVRSKKKLFDLKHDDSTRIIAVSFSGNGKRVLTVAGVDSRVWDASNGRLLLKMPGNAGSAAVFSSDGNKVVQEGTIWDINLKRRVLTLKGKSFTSTDFIYAPDDRTILSGSYYDSIIKVWDTRTGKMLFHFRDAASQRTRLSFSSDGKKILNGSRIWDARTGKLIADLQNIDKSSWISSIAPNGKTTTTGFNNGNVIVWDIDTKRIISRLTGHAASINSAFYSPDGKSIITTSPNSSAKVWNEENGIFLRNLKSHQNGQKAVLYSPDGTKIATASISTGDGVARVLNSNTNELLYELKGHRAGIRSIAFSPDGRRIVTAGLDKRVKVWDSQTGEFLNDIGNTRAGMVNHVSYFPGKDTIITLSMEGMTNFWNPGTGELVRDISRQGSSRVFAAFSPDKKRVAIIAYAVAEILDAENGKKLFDLTSLCNTVSFSKEGNFILTGDQASSISLYNAGTGSLVKKITSPGYRSAFYSNDEKRIISAAVGEMVEIYDTRKDSVVYRFTALDSIDYILLIPAGFYFASGETSKLLHYKTTDLKLITFEQLDVKYNRPDKVLKAIGSTDTALIRSYRKAYEKRIKKLGIDTTAFRDGYSVPEADFTNRDKIEYEQKNGKLKLDIKSVDSTYKLDRFNVWVNETPLYGQRGISLRSKNRNSFDSTININLSQGENRIETSITNVNGTESYRMPLLVNYTPADSQKTRTYFIGIGIDQFVDSKYNLKYSSKDIRDLTKKLKEKYKDIIIDTLFNENVTISNIKALKQKLLQTNVNDKVIISYSGHGMLSKDFDYYLSTYAVNFDKPEENGLPYDELESLLDSIPARKKLMLIDACHSGEVDKDDLVAMNATAEKLIKGLKSVAHKNEGRLGLKNSFELMQSLFVNVGKSTGATIISAAAGTEFALEGIDNLPNGVFTYCILEAMNKYQTMKISELKKIVGERVVEITKGLQKPTSRNETIAVDWEIWSGKIKIAN